MAAYSRGQRNWIVERDGDKCQAPFPHIEDTEHPKQVHHIIPQRYCAEVGIENPDFPENGITLCRTAHEIIHPDVPEARRNYHLDHQVFEKLGETREQLLKAKKPYWVTTFDRLMTVIAVRNTQRKKDEPFPEKPKPRVTIKHTEDTPILIDDILVRQ